MLPREVPQAWAAGSPSPDDRQVPQAKVSILKMYSQREGETPQTEIAIQHKSEFWKGIPPKGRPRRQKELFKKVWILTIDSPEGETPET